MEFPLDWNVSEAAEFDTAAPSSPGAVSVELFAQLRNTGRILDGFRFAIDGAAPLEVNADLYQLIPVDDCRSLRFFQQSWPRDIALRRNMVSSSWTSLTDVVSSNNADILDDSGAGISPAAFLRILGQLPSSGPVNASTRWAIVIGADGHLKLQLQALPLVASYLNNRATFRRYILIELIRSSFHKSASHVSLSGSNPTFDLFNLMSTY
jgi:hypothetical protein